MSYADSALRSESICLREGPGFSFVSAKFGGAVVAYCKSSGGFFLDDSVFCRRNRES
jgi:hypothetical protein